MFNYISDICRDLCLPFKIFHFRYLHWLFKLC